MKTITTITTTAAAAAAAAAGTKNGYLTVIRTVRIRYLSWNGYEHSFGIVRSYRSHGYAWIVLQRNTHGEPSSYVKSSIRIRGANFSRLRLQRCCEKVATNNWLGPWSFKRSSKTEPDQQKNWCENSNLNLPTNKKRLFNGYSYPQDTLRMMKRIWAQFWNRRVIPVT